MEQRVRDYFEYVQSTLGLKNLVLPRDPEVATSYKALFYLSQDPTAEDLQLLQKMIEALPLSQEEIGILIGSLGDIVESLKYAELTGPLFCFSLDEVSFLNHNLPQYKSYELPALPKMRDVPDLKRGAWKTLKLALQIP